MLVNHINIRKKHILRSLKTSQGKGSCNPRFAWGLSRRKREIPQLLTKPESAALAGLFCFLFLCILFYLNPANKACETALDISTFLAVNSKVLIISGQ